MILNLFSSDKCKKLLLRYFYMENNNNFITNDNFERLKNMSKMLCFHLAEADRLRKEMNLIMQTESYQKNIN